jgi:hypothetical protein
LITVVIEKMSTYWLSEQERRRQKKEAEEKEREAKEAARREQEELQKEELARKEREAAERKRYFSGFRCGLALLRKLELHGMICFVSMTDVHSPITVLLYLLKS